MPSAEEGDSVFQHGPVGGAGSLPGARDETGVARLPDEQRTGFGANSSTGSVAAIAGGAALLGGGAYAMSHKNENENAFNDTDGARDQSREPGASRCMRSFHSHRLTTDVPKALLSASHLPP